MAASTTVSPLAKYKLVGGSKEPARAACLLIHQNRSVRVVLVQVFLGDQSVGKTSIITRFMYDKFDNTYQVRSSPHFYVSQCTSGPNLQLMMLCDAGNHRH